MVMLPSTITLLVAWNARGDLVFKVGLLHVAFIVFLMLRQNECHHYSGDGDR